MRTRESVKLGAVFNRPFSSQFVLTAGFGVLLALVLAVTLLALARSGRGGVYDAVIAAAGLLAILIGGVAAQYVLRRVMRSEEALREARDLAEVTLRSIGDGVITVGADGCVDVMNPVAELYTGWSTAEARGRPLDEIYRVVDDRTGASLPHPGGNEKGARGSSSIAARLVRRDGSFCPIRDSSAAIHNREGNLVGWVVVFHDISQLEQMAQQLSWQATHDSLTGLVNRREFERRLAELVGVAQADKRQHALLYLDLDNFKAVNDTCGHAGGDEMLRQLTTVLQTGMRGSDTLARLGGDEFGVLLESCPLEQAVRIANGMREAVREFRFVRNDRTFGVGVSAGLIGIDGSETPERLLAAADRICYEAKSKGRDRVQVYRAKHEAEDGGNTELNMVSQINHAFELGNFRLYRQKIVALNAADGDSPHYEILVRMLDASGHPVPPGGFMPAAERYNLLGSIERWVISSLVEFLAGQCEKGAIPRDAEALTSAFYAVNLSGASINDASFTDFMRNLLTRFDLPRGLLCFEVTETTAIANLSKAAALMHDMKALGCRFALDDFGIGMSSFAYLKYLPVDYIKIDGVFVRGMATDPMDLAIVEAVNRIGHILGLKTVAEYVEDETVLARLRAIGVDYAQGYFIAKPAALLAPADTEPAVLEPA